MFRLKIFPSCKYEQIHIKKLVKDFKSKINNKETYYLGERKYILKSTLYGVKQNRKMLILIL